MLCSQRPRSSISVWQRCFFYFIFTAHTSIKFHEWSNPRNCPLKGAVVSSTFKEAILSQYWLIAVREQSLNTGGDSWSRWCKRFFCPEPLQRTACWEMKRLYKRLLERNQHDRSRSPSFLEFHGFCRAQICNVALVILFVTASDLCTLFFSCLRWSWLQWSYWRIWLLEAGPPPCSPWSCRCHSKRWWRCTDTLCFLRKSLFTHFMCWFYIK